MASTHWFTTAMLVARLTAPALGHTGPPSTSPFRDSIAREAALLAGQTAKAPQATAQWSRVRSLQPGERILVTLSAGPTLQRSFLAADDATITLLNDSNPALPEETGHDLRRLAATRARSLLIIPMGGTLRLDRLRIDPRGAFLDGNRIGDVSIIVEVHTQAEIVEIALAEWSAPKRFWQYLLGWPGVVGLTGGSLVQPMRAKRGGRAPCPTAPLLLVERWELSPRPLRPAIWIGAPQTALSTADRATQARSCESPDIESMT
jgi:hypothetical protein